MLTIIPTPAEVLCWLAEETGLEAQGLVWGFTAMQEVLNIYKDYLNQ